MNAKPTPEEIEKAKKYGRACVEAVENFNGMGGDKETADLLAALSASESEVSALKAELSEAKESLEFSREWWSTRLERLSQWVRENRLPEPFTNQYFSIIANGAKDANEQHQYWPMYNQMKYRAEKAEQKIRELEQELADASRR